MYARVTRFTGADADSIQRMVGNFEAAEGPPPGVPAGRVKLLVDEKQGTVVVIGFFETEDDLRTADEALNEFTPEGGTPGTRASVDLCEVKIERDDT